MWFIRSRKAQVAIASLVCVVLAHFNIGISEDQATNIIAIGVALILGIAHEDNAEKGGGILGAVASVLSGAAGAAPEPDSEQGTNPNP